METFDDDGELRSIFKANRLSYIAAEDKWRAKGYEIRTLDGLDDEYLVIGQGEELDTSIAIVPDDFVRHSKQMEIMTTPDLRKFVQEEQKKGLDNTRGYSIEAYKRSAAPFTILILTLIGASIGTRKVRGGLGIHLAMGVSLGALFVLISKFTETFAYNLSFAPLLGVWMPNLIFTGIAYILLTRAQK